MQDCIRAMISDDVKRLEVKYFVKSEDVNQILEILSLIMFPDKNCADLTPYKLSSLYYDSYSNSDLKEKLDGVLSRRKYRLRFYNDDYSKAKFEIKRKTGNTISKTSLSINQHQIREVVSRNFDCLFGTDNDAEIQDLYLGNYSPKTIVTYERIAFFLPYNQIRVTLDLNLRTHGFAFSLNNNLHQGISLCPDGHQIIEIKFIDTLPQVILDEISKFVVARTAISKYSAARLFSDEEQASDRPYFAW